MLIVLLIAALALLAAGIAQLAIPRVAARRIRDRLTEGGGSAEVRVAALPATRLLRERGDRLIVRGRDLRIGLGGADPGEGRAGLGALDGFEEVDVELQDFRTGPFAIAAFVLSRSGGQSYAMATQGSVKGTELMRLAEGLLGGIPVSTVIDAVPGMPLVSREVSLSVQIELISEGGRLRVGTGGGSIAGYPAGPVATLIAAAVARRLELAP